MISPPLFTQKLFLIRLIRYHLQVTTDLIISVTAIYISFSENAASTKNVSCILKSSTPVQYQGTLSIIEMLSIRGQFGTL